MAKDNQILVRVNDPTNDAIESFAEKHDYTKAEAARRMIEDRLAGEGHLEGGRAVPDGGQILDRVNAIEQQQAQRLDEIESHQERIESKLDQPWYIDLLDKTVLWSWAFMVTGIILWALAATGKIGASPDLATILTLVSGFIFVVSRGTMEVIK